MDLQVLSKFDTTAATSYAVESLLLTPITNAFSTAGDAVSRATESILRSSTYDYSLLAGRPHAPFVDERQVEKREDNSLQHRLSVDIQPRYDGSGIELIAKTDHSNMIKSQKKELSKSNIQGSLLMFDPQAAEAENSEMMPMNLKILRGKNLPFDNSRIRIGVVNLESGEIDQIIGTTPSSEGSRDPIWGSRSCAWTLNANHSTKLIFTLLPKNVGEKKNNRKNLPATICANAFAVDLLSKRNPNFWTVLKDQDNPTGFANYGRIQIRLTRPTEAKIHKQENCRRITPGPAIPRIQSYAIRKMALYSCSPVMLNVYDVSNNPRIQTINNTTKSFGYGGLFHTAIEIQGKEYSFGGTFDKKSKVSGVFQCSPKQCPMHHYRESVFLGDCELNSQQVQNILTGLRRNWIARSYNVFRNNCTFFCREFSIELGVGDLPEWVFSLARTAESIEPYLHKINTYLKNKTKATTPKSSRKRITKLISLKHASRAKEVTIDTHENIEAHMVANSTQEVLLDHAMAARIQRSFRVVSARRSRIRRAKALRKLQTTFASA